MDSNSKIFVAGHKGLVGSAIVRNLKEKGFTNILTVDRNQVDLTDLTAVKCFSYLSNQSMFLWQQQRLAVY